MKNKLKKFVLKLEIPDTKTVTTVIATLMASWMILTFIALVAKLFAHKDISVEIMSLLASYWFIRYTISKYKLDSLKDELNEADHALDDLGHLLMTIKQANSKGVMVQDLERQGVLKMEIIKVVREHHHTHSHENTPEELTELEKELIEKHKKKEKLTN